MNGPAQHDFRRARSAAQKAERRADLIAAARAILDAEGAEACTLAAVAARAGLAKSAVYRYFESREMILLTVLIEDTEETVVTLEAEVPARAGDPGAIAALIADHFAARPRLCALTAMMAPTLERNLSTEALLEVKTRMLALFLRTGAALAAALPGLGPEGARIALKTLVALVAGHWPMDNPGPQVERILQRPEFAPFAHGFRDDLRTGLHAVLVGASAAAGR